MDRPIRARSPPLPPEGVGGGEALGSGAETGTGAVTAAAGKAAAEWGTSAG